MPEPSVRDAAGPVKVLADRYRMLHAVGHGGKATVYVADDLLLSRQVAVKAFHTRAETPDAVREQEAEAKVVASLNHPALTTLFDAGVDSSDPEHPQLYLVMEYLRGGDLRQRLSAGALDPIHVCWLGRDLAEGLQYLHDQGFLHRDVKPANVLLADADPAVRPRAKLADFGIASLAGFAHNEDFVTGTAAYLSPEQAEGSDGTAASDTYALGLVLLEALTGRVEFPGGIEEAALARLDRDPRVDPWIPAPVADVVRAMTHRDPARRMPLTDVAAAFQEVLLDRLVQQRVAASAVSAEEQQRLEAVHRYDIVGTPPEDAFDRITGLASRLLRAPIAMVSIIDRDRVWLASRLGTDEQEFDRNVSFCATTNPGDGAWTIRDATLDPRTADNPVVVGEPNVRSYAAAPLTTSDGHNLGSLCVYDLVPRDFDEEALATLTDLASLVMHELELRLASRRAIFGR